MEIRFFATIREITRVREVRWDQPAASVLDLLLDLSARYGPQFRRWCLDGQDLGQSIIVLVNGRDCRHESGVHTPLRSGDVISIFPMVAGGTGERR